MHWIDRLARRTARPSAADAQPTPSTARHHTRRDFLRRAAIVGAASWSVPTLQSVAAPAHAASGCSQGTCGTGTGCPLCDVGFTCLVGAECVTQRCSGGTCQPGLLGDPCDTSSQCAEGVCVSGVCTKGSVGDPCDAPIDCITGICSGGTCQAGGIGTPCGTSADCSVSGCYGRPGGPRTCGGPGAPCTSGGNAACTYGNCSDGVCGGWLAACDTNAQCQQGKGCFLGWFCV